MLRHLLCSLASSAALKPAILRAGAVVQLVRLVEERGSSAAQQALDRLSICDAAVKKQIEWSLSREGPTVTLTLTLTLALALALTLALTTCCSNMSPIIPGIPPMRPMSPKPPPG